MIMGAEKREKYERLNEIIEELNELNGNIARLAFYLNENEIDEDYKCLLDAQLRAMVKYREILDVRIESGTWAMKRVGGNRLFFVILIFMT